ncbi:MAG TPA: preprotein translocase subunit SecE [Nitrospiria bacterium]|nr:preprotein translocase subunit SecE [Nitrospiria bacterium]
MQGLWGRIAEFFNDVRAELKKVAYPTRAETVGSTTVVLILVLIIGVFLSFLDMVLVKAVRLIIQ